MRAEQVSHSQWHNSPVHVWILSVGKGNIEKRCEGGSAHVRIISVCLGQKTCEVIHRAQQGTWGSVGSGHATHEIPYHAQNRVVSTFGDSSERLGGTAIPCFEAYLIG